MKSDRIEGRIIIFSAPSGSGKSTILSRIINDPELNLGFSISATSREPRGEEQDGREYYFISHEEFKRRAEAGEFVEWEEVYPGKCYGTLASEVERITSSGRNLIMDIDVIGGINVKNRYSDRVLSIFISPPSIDELSRRLNARGTDAPDVIKKRLEKADYEMSFAPQFDKIIVNDDLDQAVEAVRSLIKDFISSGK